MAAASSTASAHTTVPARPALLTGNFGADRQQRAVAVALADLDAVDHLARAADADVAHGVRHRGIDGHELERPVPEITAELHVEVVLERGTVAGQRGADALHERHHLRIVAQPEHVGAAPALRGQHAVLKNQALAPGFERALLEMVRRLVQQLARGAQRPLEHRHLMHLGEAHPAVAARGQQSEQRGEVVVRCVGLHGGGRHRRAGGRARGEPQRRQGAGDRPMAPDVQGDWPGARAVASPPCQKS